MTTKYKYLGVTFESTGKFTTDIANRKKKAENIKKYRWILRNKKINGVTKYQILCTLFTSRWLYGTEILSTLCKDFRYWLKSEWYRSLKDVLGIKTNPNKDKLL